MYWNRKTILLTLLAPLTLTANPIRYATSQPSSCIRVINQTEKALNVYHLQSSQSTDLPPGAHRHICEDEQRILSLVFQPHDSYRTFRLVIIDDFPTLFHCQKNPDLKLGPVACDLETTTDHSTGRNNYTLWVQ